VPLDEVLSPPNAKMQTMGLVTEMLVVSGEEL
jgi:hypothetical protein